MPRIRRIVVVQVGGGGAVCLAAFQIGVLGRQRPLVATNRRQQQISDTITRLSKNGVSSKFAQNKTATSIRIRRDHHQRMGRDMTTQTSLVESATSRDPLDFNRTPAWVVELLVPHLGQPQTILDAGCGGRGDWEGVTQPFPSIDDSRHRNARAKVYGSKPCSR